MAIHEERGEDERALEVALRTYRRARETGLAGWVGEAIAIRIASLLARAGDIGGAEARVAEVGPGWQAWGTWEVERPEPRLPPAAATDATPEPPRSVPSRGSQRWPYFDRARCSALLAPALADAGHPAGPARSSNRRSRRALRASGRSPAGGARLAALDEGDVDAAIGALAAAWAQAGDQVQHLIRREWPRIERPLWDALAAGAVEVQSTSMRSPRTPGRAALEASPAIRFRTSAGRH